MSKGGRFSVSLLLLLLLLLHEGLLLQAAPLVDAFELREGMRWDASKLLELQQLLEDTHILYLRIVREQQVHRSLIEVALVIDFITLACVFLVFLRCQKKDEKQKLLIEEKVGKVEL
ncbi:hypothetical protein KR222_006003 [Zaprionus bogoriensis]|nr:hypothetical protein KR222_006003 [Zaprionus bogoriensis]